MPLNSAGIAFYLTMEHHSSFGLLLTLLSSAHSFQLHQALLVQPAPHLLRCKSSCSAAAEFLAFRFGCTEAEAIQYEAKLLPNMKLMNHARAVSLCNSLQERLSLSESQLRKIVVSHPQVLGYSFESNVAFTLS